MCKSSKRVKRCKVAFTHSSPNHQLEDTNVGLAGSDILLPDKRRQEAYIKKTKRSSG